MRKVILQEFVSLDGFAAGPNGELDFVGMTEDSRKNRQDIADDALRFIAGVDTMLLGAVTYRMFSAYWPTTSTAQDPIADALNSLDKVVFSKTLEGAPWGAWKEGRVVRSNPADEVRRLKQQAGKDMVVWGSLTLAHTLIAEGLVDEYELRVVPVLIGRGKRFVPDDIGKLDLERLEPRLYVSGLTLLRYRSTGGAPT